MKKKKIVGAIQAMVLYVLHTSFVTIYGKKRKKRRYNVCRNRNGHKENIEKYINLDLCELKFGSE